MLSASTVRVAYLKILERKMGSAYHADKWVRKVRGRFCCPIQPIPSTGSSSMLFAFMICLASDHGCTAPRSWSRAENMWSGHDMFPVPVGLGAVFGTLKGFEPGLNQGLNFEFTSYRYCRLILFEELGRLTAKKVHMAIILAITRLFKPVTGSRINGIFAVALASVIFLAFYVPSVLLGRKPESSNGRENDHFKRAGVLVSYAYFEKDSIQVLTKHRPSYTTPCAILGHALRCMSACGLVAWQIVIHACGHSECVHRILPPPTAPQRNNFELFLKTGTGPSPTGQELHWAFVISTDECAPCKGLLPTAT